MQYLERIFGLDTQHYWSFKINTHIVWSIIWKRAWTWTPTPTPTGQIGRHMTDRALQNDIREHTRLFLSTCTAETCSPFQQMRCTASQIKRKKQEKIMLSKGKYHYSPELATMHWLEWQNSICRLSLGPEELVCQRTKLLRPCRKRQQTPDKLAPGAR